MPSDNKKFPPFYTLPYIHNCFRPKVLQIEFWALLNSTESTGTWKIFEMRCFKRKKKMVFLFIFPCFPPPYAPRSGCDDILQPLSVELEDKDRDRGNDVLIGPWSIPSEKGYRNCSLPGELFYWAYLQLSSGMCDKLCILIFLPYSPLGHYCLQNCFSWKPRKLQLAGNLLTSTK